MPESTYSTREGVCNSPLFPVGSGREAKKGGPLAELFAKIERSRSLQQKNNAKMQQIPHKYRSTMSVTLPVFKCHK